VWRGGGKGEPELLAEDYRSVLALAVSEGLRTIAVPSISTGAYGYPIEKASRTALRTVKEYLENEKRLDEIVFVLFSQYDLEKYIKASTEVFKI
jgi:O-acetyl-ADP-ribose deacetylase (regulator of RNase III)